MKLAVFQYAPRFGEQEANLDSMRRALSGVDCDLLVLPELALTGYQFTSREELASMAEPVPGGETCTTLAEIASEIDSHIVFGLPEDADGRFFNTAVLIGPEGYVGKYRKAHLFFEEKLLFEPGDTGFEVFDIGIARVGMLVCFDWLFPEAARILALKGAQVVVQPANLVLPWCQEVALARAWENKVFFVTVNRTGSESRGGRRELKFTGRSQVVTPGGEILFRLGEDEEAVKTVEIDVTAADDKNVTEHNEIFSDRRTDLYGPLVE